MKREMSQLCNNRKRKHTNMHNPGGQKPVSRAPVKCLILGAPSAMTHQPERETQAGRNKVSIVPNNSPLMHLPHLRPLSFNPE